MTEKMNIGGKEIWIKVEPHASRMPGDDAREFFTASYHVMDPNSEPGGSMFLDNEGKPVSFDSPVQALEYAAEKLSGD